MTTVHLGMNAAKKLRARAVPDDMPRAVVLATLADLVPWQDADWDTDSKGNRTPTSPWDDDALRDILRGIPEQYGVYDDAPRVMDVTVSPDSTLLQAAAEVLTCWYAQSAETAPTWVSSDSPGLTAVLVDEFEHDLVDTEEEDDRGQMVTVTRRDKVRDIATGPPADVEGTHYTLAGAPGVDSGAGWHGKPAPKARRGKGGGGLGPHLTVLMSLGVLALTRLMLHTSAGIDLMSRVMFDTASNGTGSYAASNWLACARPRWRPARLINAGTPRRTARAAASRSWSHRGASPQRLLTPRF